MSQPIAPKLIENAADGPRLIAGRRKSDGRLVFPLPQSAAADGYEPVHLAREGRLWSWTVQRFRPKSPPYSGPEEFEPYAVGYVELPGELIVESRLQTDDFAALKIGMPLQLVLQPFASSAHGEPVVTYAFRPSTDEKTA